jgi:hydrogenase-4 component F
MEMLILLALPLCGAGLLALVGARRRAAEVNVAFSFATLVAGGFLTARVIEQGPQLYWNEAFFVDPFNVFLVALTAFVNFTTALFSRRYMRIEERHGRLSASRLRLYHSMYQLFMFTMLLALLTNNMGILWVAMEAATLSTVLLVSLYRTLGEPGSGVEVLHPVRRRHRAGAVRHHPAVLRGRARARARRHERAAVDAARRGEGRARAHRARDRLRVPAGRLRHQGRARAAAQLAARRARRGSHTGLGGALGLLLNVALYAVIRCKVLVEGSIRSELPGQMLMFFGLVSVLVAAFMLWRQKDIKRLFGYSSIEHMGIITFAFGMGGPVANFAALLHMTVHSLTKSAIFFAVGHAVQKAGTQQMDDIRGLMTLSPALGWGLMLGSLAILGMPPFGVFASEFLILTTAMREQPWATPLLLLALGVAFAAVFGRAQAMVFGPPSVAKLPEPPSLLPVFVHLALVLMLGLWIPPFLAGWYRLAAGMIG